MTRIIHNLLDAELELAPNRAARIALREQMVNQLKEIEKVADEAVRVGVAENADLLEVKAARLQAEIDLVREGADGK